MRSPLLYAGLFLVLALFTALFVPFFVDWSQYREDIEAYGERLTGRKVTVGGGISVRVLPAPVLKVENLTVSNPPGATSENFLVAESVTAKLSLAPLLRGKIDVSSVAVEAPVIEAELLADGGTWALKPRGGFDKRVAIDDVRLDDTRLNGGTLILRDPSRGVAERVENLDLTLHAPSLAGPFRASGSFSHDGVDRTFRVSVGKHREGEPIRLAVTLNPGEAGGRRLAFDGRLTEKDGAPAFDGRVRVAEVPAATGEEAGGTSVSLAAAVPVEIRAQTVATLDEMAFEDVQFILGKGSARATLGGKAHLDFGDTPNLSVNLAARRLDLDAIVRKQRADGDDVPVGTREVLSQIPRLLDLVPRSLAGQLRVDVEGLVLGGQQVEGAGVTLEFTPDRLKFTRAVGRLPGQTQVSVTGTYDANRTDVRFDGIFALKARDAKTFLTWVAPKTRPIINPQAGGARGNLSLKGELRVVDHLVELIGVQANLDKTSARMAMSYALTDRPSFGLRIIMDELNVDRYLPPARKPDGEDASADNEADGTEDEDAAEQSAGAAALAILDEFDANIIARADRIIFNGTGVRDIAIDTTLRAGDLTIKELTVQNFGGAQIGMSGMLSNLAEQPKGTLEALVRANDPTGLLALMNVGPEDADRNAAWLNWAALWGPTNFSANLEAVPNDAGAKVSLKANGVFGQSRMTFEGTFDGNPAAAEDGRVDMMIELANDQGAELFRQIGLAKGTSEKARNQSGVLRGKVTGQPSRGLEVTAGIEAFGAQITANGTSRRVAGLTSLESEINVTAGDAASLYDVLGIAGDNANNAPGGPLKLRALVAGKDGEFVVTGLTGSVNDIPVDINGTFDFNQEKPEIRLTANMAELSLPWAFGVLLNRGSNEVADAVVEATSAIEGDGGPLWAVDGFGDEMFQRFDLDLKAEVSRLGLSGAHAMRGAELVAKIGGGKAEISKLSGRAFDGRLDVTGVMTARRGQLSLEGEYDLRDATLSQIVGGEDPPVEGKLSSKGRLRGQGRNVLALLSSLSGQGELSLADGLLNRFAADRFSETLDGIFKDAMTKVSVEDLEKAQTEEEIDEATRTVLQRGETRIADLETTYTVATGVVEVAPVNIEGEATSGTARMKIDLPSWTFDSDWRLNLEKFPNAPPLRVVIDGSVDAMAHNVDNTDLKSFLTVKLLRDKMEVLEEQERRAREALEKERQAMEALEKAAEEKLKAEEARKAREAEARRKAEEAQRERLKREAERAEAERQASLGQQGTDDGRIGSSEETISSITDFIEGADRPVWFSEVDARGFEPHLPAVE